MQGGADVLDRPKGWSLLHLAAAMGHDSCVNYLLGCNVPVDGTCFSSFSSVLNTNQYCYVFAKQQRAQLMSGRTLPAHIHHVQYDCTTSWTMLFSRCPNDACMQFAMPKEFKAKCVL